MDNFLDAHAGYGLEQITREDMKIPFLLILQNGSPQVGAGPDKVEGAEAGDFFNNVTNELYGKEIDLIVLGFEKIWLEWKPNRGGLVAKHVPDSISIDQSDFSNWTYNGNNISETFAFCCLITNHINEGPIIFALSNTGAKHAKNWNTLIRMQKLESGKAAPIFGVVWRLTATLNKNEHGSWYQVGAKSTNIRKVRFITENEYLTFVKPSIELLSARDVDYGSLSDNSGGGGGGGDDIDPNVPY